jgi:hypothetical protein
MHLSWGPLCPSQVSLLTSEVILLQLLASCALLSTLVNAILWLAIFCVQLGDQHQCCSVDRCLLRVL